jgi:Domain of unknown function (DUF1906)
MWGMGFPRRALTLARRAAVPAVAVLAAVMAAWTPAARAMIWVPAGAARTPAADGWRTVSYLGVGLRVPASWPVRDLARHPADCPRLDRHAVYLGRTGPAPDCPASLTGKTEAVQVQPAEPGSPDVRAAVRAIVIDGHRATTNPDSALSHTIIDVIPAAGAEVSVSYGRDLGLARRIAASITVGRPGPATAALASQADRSAAAALARAAAAVKPSPPQGLFRGAGFDTCAAPSVSALTSWQASPYRAVGIYIGGVNRACSQSDLTASWITAIRAHGWRYFPFYVGLQASCGQAFGDTVINPADAAAEGTAAAQDAVAQAQSLGIPRGTPIIYDMEAYSGCAAEVITFLSAWDSAVQAKGYQSGVYESFSDIGDLVHAADRMTEPDVIHYADWDGQATTASRYMPAGLWTGHQRLHQYQGGHTETWGGVAMNIDNDQLDVNLSGPSPPATAGLRPAFRIAVTPTGSGSVQWFAKTAAGRLVSAATDRARGSGWSAVTRVGSPPAAIGSNPAVAADADGRLVVFARADSGQIEHAWQAAGLPGRWRWGAPLAGAGAPAGGIGDPAAIRRPGGTVEVFVTGSGGAVDTVSQAVRNNDSRWTGWTSLGGDCATTPVPVTAPGGRVELLCTTAGHALAVDGWHSGSWSGWGTVGSGPAVRGVPAVLAGPAGQTEALAATEAGGLAYAWQDPAGQWQWGTGPAAARSGLKVSYSPAATAWPGGKIAVLARLSGGRLGYAVQSGGGSAPAWAGWATVSGSVLGSPAAWLGPGGEPQAAVLDARLRLAAAGYSAGDWSSWTELAGGF